MSHLPLLFAEGQPTCLEKITQPQLEKFVPFMLQCCPRSKGGPPPWWPREVPYAFPMRPPLSLRLRWSTILKDIVLRCYKHYESTYILAFCRKLASLGPKRILLKENADRLDIFDCSSNKLLVSVKAKNKTYDQVQASPHKSLLPQSWPQPNSYKNQPVIDDIYLCSYCDAEFTCCNDACEHERTVHAPAEEDKSTPQEKTLKCIGLIPVSADESKKDIVALKPRRITSNLCLKNSQSIPICTPLGRLLLANTVVLRPFEIAKSLQRLEEFCRTDDVDITAKTWCESNGFRRSRRVPGATNLSQRFRAAWTHKYCFNKQQRAEKMETIKTGLDANSRRLLRRCRPVKVTMRRLPPLPGNTTIDLRRLKEYLALEFPNTNILEPPKVIAPPQPVVSRQPLPTPVHSVASPQPATQFFNHSVFNNRLPLVGVPSNRLPFNQVTVKQDAVTGIITKRVPFNHIKRNNVPTVHRPTAFVPLGAIPSSAEPIVIDLCSSDEECEVVEKTDKELYPPIVNAPKYGVTAASPKENCPKVAETEMAGIPAKNNHRTNLYVQQFCRTRS